MTEDTDPRVTAEEAAGPDGAEPEAAPIVPGYGKQACLQCGYPISDVAGSKAAVCPNCGFKDPCC